jgi:hypothetical protein
MTSPNPVREGLHIMAAEFWERAQAACNEAAHADACGNKAESDTAMQLAEFATARAEAVAEYVEEQIAILDDAESGA